jgi:hypothetical protein
MLGITTSGVEEKEEQKKYGSGEARGRWAWAEDARHCVSSSSPLLVRVLFEWPPHYLLNVLGLRRSTIVASTLGSRATWSQLS